MTLLCARVPAEHHAGSSDMAVQMSQEEDSSGDASEAKHTNGGGSQGDQSSQEGSIVGGGSVTGTRTGRCKWFNVTKGWGFITPDDGGQDVFVHQSVIQMPGFRSLGGDELVEFECKVSEKGLEATRVSGPSAVDCHGSKTFNKKRLRKLRCYNCGEFANHIAAKCTIGPQPKRCHSCKSEDHLIADCPAKKDRKQPSEQSGSQSISGQNGDQSVESIAESVKAVRIE